MAYIISYYLYSPGLEKMPYKVLGIRNTNIEYSYKSGLVEFRLNRMYRKDAQATIGNSEYHLYISNNAEDITAMTRCSLGAVFTVTQAKEGDIITATSYREYVTFSIKVIQV